MVVNSRLQDLFNGHAETLPVLAAQTSDRARRAQLSEKEALARINVPYPNHYRCVHQKDLKRSLECLRTLQEIGTGKRLGKRLWPQMTQAWVLQEFRFSCQKAHTETSCVMEAQFQPRS